MAVNFSAVCPSAIQPGSSTLSAAAYLSTVGKVPSYLQANMELMNATCSGCGVPQWYACLAATMCFACMILLVEVKLY